jgi:hypothetical protein
MVDGGSHGVLRGEGVLSEIDKVIDAMVLNPQKPHMQMRHQSLRQHARMELKRRVSRT